MHRLCNTQENTATEKYAGYLDETWRFTCACRTAKPTIYREGRTFLIEGAELFAGFLWFFTVELVWDTVHVHGRIPYIHEEEWRCISEQEWLHLLRQARVPQNPFLLRYRRLFSRIDYLFPGVP